MREHFSAFAMGLAPWLRLELALGAFPVDAGFAVQLALTLLLFGLCFFVPMNDRVMRLENSHRSFRVTMRDVAQAYQAAHAADREGCFRLKGEFDSVALSAASAPFIVVEPLLARPNSTRLVSAPML